MGPLAFSWFIIGLEKREHETSAGVLLGKTFLGRTAWSAHFFNLVQVDRVEGVTVIFSDTRQLIL